MLNAFPRVPGHSPATPPIGQRDVQTADSASTIFSRGPGAARNKSGGVRAATGSAFWGSLVLLQGPPSPSGSPGFLAPMVLSSQGGPEYFVG